MKALQRLAGTVPPGYDFRIGFCRVNSVDPTHIRKVRFNAPSLPAAVRRCR